MKTFVPRAEEIIREWFLVDANGKTLGRLATKIANILRGRNKPTFTPHVDTGHFVVVINADKVKVSGRKETGKRYRFYTGFRGGNYETPLADIRAKHPERLIEHAVKGMLPKNNMNRSVFKRLKVYAGDRHPHAAQNPKLVEIKI